MLPGLSTLGVKFGYAVEPTAGTKPTSYTWLHRVNSVGGISMNTAQIDASAIEDTLTQYIAGRQDTGGQWSVKINLTDDTINEWTTLIAAYNAGLTDGKSMWFTLWSPSRNKSFYIKAQPPQNIPLPEFTQNTLQTADIVLTVQEYMGLDTAIEPQNA